MRVEEERTIEKQVKGVHITCDDCGKDLGWHEGSYCATYMYDDRIYYYLDENRNDYDIFEMCKDVCPECRKKQYKKIKAGLKALGFELRTGE